MKQYIMIIIIALHLINANLYAVDTFVKQHDIHECAIVAHDHDHDHYHTHNGSNHSHKHNHTQVHASLSDFLIFSHDTSFFTFEDTKEKHSEMSSWVPAHILKSLFRPPIV